MKHVPVSSGITAWSEFFSCLNCMLPSNSTTDTVLCIAAHRTNTTKLNGEHSVTMPHPTQFMPFRRWSQQPIAWLVMTRENTQLNTTHQNSTTKDNRLPRFCRLVQQQHLVRKWGAWFILL